ncbi:MAG: ATP-binding protein [Lachnospiraceae bacterium]|nr:ATP-binding protein [Lachnospiraceae bacterium]
MSLSKNQYDSITREYEWIRDSNRAELADREAKVYEAIPQLKELNASYGALCASKMRLLLEGSDNTENNFHESLDEISRKKKELLLAHGFKEDYLDPIYVCADCKDTGYITGQDGIKEKCHCFRQRELKFLYQQSNIYSLISRENFGTLSYEYQTGENLTRLKKCVEFCTNFVQNFKHDYRNLFIYGTVGTGKSYLSGCIAYELLKKHYSVIYFSANNFFDTLARYAFNPQERNSLTALYEDIYNCDLLIIDDLGCELTNSFVSAQLFSCINERHIRHNSTIISSNLSLEELKERYSDRTFSRISSYYEFFKLTGNDVRMMLKRKK